MKIFKRILAVALVAISLFAVALPVLAYYDSDVDTSLYMSATVKTPANGGNVIVRSGPTVSSSTYVDEYKPTTKITVYRSKSYSDSWYRLKFDGVWCFIMKSMVTVN